MNLKHFFIILQKAYNKLRNNNPLRLAGATAFFATFALPPILIILLQTFGIFFSTDAMKKGMFAELTSVLGEESSKVLYTILEQFQKLANNWAITISGFVFLLFVATTLLNVVRTSMNELWNIELEKRNIRLNLKLRLKSVFVIFLSGLILIIQLAASGLQALLRNYINEIWSGYNSFLYKAISQLIFVIIATLWFTILFKYLANAHPNWKIAFTGGVFTGIFFTVGKIVLGLLLTFSNLKTIFGASGSFVLILLFVFYSSFIFYYGASFTKIWADEYNKKMRLDKHVYVIQ